MTATATTVDPEVDAQRATARQSQLFGLVAVGLAFLVPCSSCTTLFLAAPAAGLAVHWARGVLADPKDEVAEAYARNGLATGIMALVYSLAILALIFAYVMLYVGIIALAVGGAVVAPTPVPAPIGP